MFGFQDFRKHLQVADDGFGGQYPSLQVSSLVTYCLDFLKKSQMLQEITHQLD